MPILLRLDERAQNVVNAVVHLIDTEGVDAVSIRNIAALVRIRPSTLTSHLTNKARILHLSGKQLADQIDREIGTRCCQKGMVGFLPDAEGLPAHRAWLGLTELARTQPDLAAVVAQARSDRTDLVREVVGGYGLRLPDSSVDAVLATIDGLTAAMCADVDPWSTERAERALRVVLEAVDRRLAGELDEVG